MDYVYGYMNLFVGLYSFFLIVFGGSILVLIWVSIIYMIKKMRRFDRIGNHN